MKLVTAPETYWREGGVRKPTIFLTGGITNCPNWQDMLIQQLQNEDAIIYNPRRNINDIKSEADAIEQINWEHKYLHYVDILVFWFSRGSLNPITLYEYGRYAMSSDRPVFVGIDPLYERKLDVITQTELSRPEIMPIAESVYELGDYVKQYMEKHYFV